MSTRGQNRRMWVPVLALLVLLTIIALLIFQRTFVLKQVRVVSDGSYSDTEIMRMAKLGLGDSIFGINEARVKWNIENDGSLVFDSMQTVLPSTVVLTVHARAKEAMLVSGGKIAVIDRDGFIVEILDSMPENAYLYITGIEISSCTPGSVIGLSQAKLQAVKEIISGVKDLCLDSIIIEVDLSDLNSIMLYTVYGYDVDIGGAENVEGKLRLANAAMTQMRVNGYLRGRLDVSGGRTADFKAY